MWTIAIGNPWDGMTLHGLYDNVEDAINAASEFYVDWWIQEIESVN